MRRKVLVSLLVLGLVLTLFVSCASLGRKKDVLAGKWKTAPFDGEEGTMTLDIDGRGAFSVYYDDVLSYTGSYEIKGDVVQFLPVLKTLPDSDYTAYVFLGDPINPATTPYKGGDKVGMCYFADSVERPDDDEMYFILDCSEEGKYYKDDDMIIEFTEDKKFILSVHFLSIEEGKTVCDGILYDIADRIDNPDYVPGSMDWVYKIENLITKESYVASTFPIQDDKLNLWFFFKDFGILECEFIKQSE